MAKGKKWRAEKRAPAEAARAPRRLVLAFVAAIVGVTAAIAMVAQRWRSAPVIEPPKQEGYDQAETEQVFREPAFMPGASVADLQQAARVVVDELNTAFPDRPESLNVRGWLRNNLGDTVAAVEDMERAIRLDPTFTDPLMSLATVARQKGEHERAVGFLRRVREISPDDLPATILLGQVLMAQGQSREAIDMLEAIAGKGNTAVELLSPLGHAYLQAEDYAKARETLEKVVAADPGVKNAWYALGKACARLGEQARAKECMERFRVLNSEDHQQNANRIRGTDDLAEMRRIATDAHHESAKVYLKHGRAEKAEELWRRAAVLDRKHVECRLALASLYERASRPDKALRWCQEICEARPERADGWFYLGALSARLGRFDDARSALDKAVDLDPRNPKYREVREAVRKAGY